MTPDQQNKPLSTSTPTHKLFFLLLLILIISFITIYTASAYTSPTVGELNVYVDTNNGNNNNGNGSASNPWRSIDYAVDQIPQGTKAIIHIAPGIYHGHDLDHNYPIYLPDGISLIGEDPATTILDIGSGYTDGIFFQAYNNTYEHVTEIRNLTVRNGESGILGMANVGGTIEYIIDNVHVENNRQSGILVISWSPTDHLTASLNNIIATNNGSSGLLIRSEGTSHVNISQVTSTYNSNGIYAGTSDHRSQLNLHVENATLAYNEEHGIVFNGIGFYQETASELNAHLERSHIHNNNQYGIYWNTSETGADFNASLHNNVINDNLAGGIYVGPSAPNYTQSHINIINNTIVNNQNYGIYWNNQNTPVKMNVVNTILANPSATNLHSTNQAWNINHISHSLLDTPYPQLMSRNIYRLPHLNTDHTPRPCSPAINAGLNIYYITNDFNGTPRHDGHTDIGAHEFAGPCALDTHLTISPNYPQANTPIDHHLTLSNNSNASQTITLTDHIPNDATYLSVTSSQDTPIYTSNTLTWTTTLMPQQTITLQFQIEMNTLNYPYIHTPIIHTSPENGIYTLNADITSQPLFLPTVFNQFCTQAYTDNFDNPNSGWPSGTTQSGLHYGYVDSGHYQLYLPQDNQWFAVTRNDYWNPSEKVETTGHIGNNANGYYGLLFGLNNDWSDFYAFEVLPQYNRWAMTHFNSNTGWSIVDIQEISLNNSLNTLAIVNNPNHANQMFLQVNGTTVKTLGHHLGRVGLTGGAFTNNIDIRHDNYLFAAPHCPTTSNLTNKTAPKHIPQLPQSLIETAISNYK
ncbi:MAG TPA: right-handed parallel beta-helix repeat-containing protein [Anaerolineae bacterium]|nr:right-handed parallel beta-helix repeat-containing protein [Anaerolineae bacterium]